MKSKKGIIFVFVASASFATMGACLKYAMGNIPFYEAVFFRGVVSSLILGLVIVGKRLPALGQNQKVLFLRGVCGFIATSCGFYSLSKIPLGDASVLHHTAPLFVVLSGAALLGEKITRSLLLLMLLALVGVVLVVQPQWDVFNFPGLMALANGAFAGLAYTMVRRLHKTDSSWVIVFHFMVVSSLLSLPIMVVAGFVPPTRAEWIALLSAGLFGTFGQTFITIAFKYDSASRLAPFSYVAVIVSLFYGMIFWGEVPNLLSLAGIVIIVACGVVISRLKITGEPPVVVESSGP